MAGLSTFVIPGRERSERARNPYSLQGLWIPGLRQVAHPGMTSDIALSARPAKDASILYLGKIRHRARGDADFIEQFQTVFARFRIVVVDLDLVEERIHRRTQFRHRAHRAGEIFLRDSGAG